MAAQAVRPEKLLRELDEQWASTGKRSEGETGGGVLRACSLTLVVVDEENRCSDEQAARLAELTREHPNRTILLRLRSGEEPFLDTRVSVVCWMPFGKRQQICSEQLLLTCSEGGLGGLPPFLSALLVADLPVVVWYRDALRAGHKEMKEISRMAGKVLFDGRQLDSPAAALAAVEECKSRGALVADLAWTALTPWRELIAQIFSPRETRERLETIDRIEVAQTGPGSHWSELLLAAWIATSLGWRWQEGEFLAEDRRIPVRYGNGAGPDRLIIGSGDWEMSLTRESSGMVEIKREGFTSGTLFPTLEPEQLVAAELSILGKDPVFQKTQPMLRQLLPG